MRVTRDGERRWALAFIVAAASSCGNASGDANGVGRELPTGVVEAEEVRVEERPCMWAGEGPRSWDLDEGLHSSEMAGAVIEWVRGMHCSEHDEARLIEAVEQVGSYDVNDSALAERVRARAPECLAAARASVLVDQVVASRFCPLADSAYVPIGGQWRQYLGLWNLRQELEATTVVLPPGSDANYVLDVQYVVGAVAATTPFSWGTGGFSLAEATAAAYLVALDAWSRRWRAPGVTPERIRVICDAVRTDRVAIVLAEDGGLGLSSPTDARSLSHPAEFDMLLYASEIRNLAWTIRDWTENTPATRCDSACRAGWAEVVARIDGDLERLCGPS